MALCCGGQENGNNLQFWLAPQLFMPPQRTRIEEGRKGKGWKSWFCRQPWALTLESAEQRSRGGEINYFARLFLEIVQSVVQRSQWREERAAADCHEVHKVPVYVSSTVVMNLYVYDVVRK